MKIVQFQGMIDAVIGACANDINRQKQFLERIKFISWSGDGPSIDLDSSDIREILRVFAINHIELKITESLHQNEIDIICTACEAGHLTIFKDADHGVFYAKTSLDFYAFTGRMAVVNCVEYPLDRFYPGVVGKHTIFTDNFHWIYRTNYQTQKTEFNNCLPPHLSKIDQSDMDILMDQISGLKKPKVPNWIKDYRLL